MKLGRNHNLIITEEDILRIGIGEGGESPLDKVLNYTVDDEDDNPNARTIEDDELADIVKPNSGITTQEEEDEKNNINKVSKDSEKEVESDDGDSDATDDDESESDDSSSIGKPIFDREGNQIDPATKKVIKTKEEIAAEKEAAASEGEEEGEPESTGLFDEEGNEVDVKGKIIRTAEEVENAYFDELPFVKQMAKMIQIVPTDDEGKPIEYEDTFEGMAKYVDDVAAIRLQQKEKQHEATRPQIVKDFENHILVGGKPEEFLNSPTISIDNLKASRENDEDNKAVIRAYYKMKGFNDDEINKQIRRAEATDELYEDAAALQPQLLELDKQAKEAKAAQVQEMEKQNLEARRATISKATDIVKSGKLGDIRIPDDQVASFLKYLFEPTERVEGGHTIPKHQQERMQLSLEKDLEIAFLMFNGYNVSRLVRDKVNLDKTATLRDIAARSKGRGTGVGTKAKKETNSSDKTSGKSILPKTTGDIL